MNTQYTEICCNISGYKQHVFQIHFNLLHEGATINLSSKQNIMHYPLFNNLFVNVYNTYQNRYNYLFNYFIVFAVHIFVECGENICVTEVCTLSIGAAHYTKLVIYFDLLALDFVLTSLLCCASVIKYRSAVLPISFYHRLRDATCILSGVTHLNQIRASNQLRIPG